MLGLDARAARVTWTTIVILAIAGLAFLARKTLFIFVLALFFAYMLRPVILFIDRRVAGRRMPKNATVVLAYIVFIGILVGIGFLIGSVVSDQAASLAENLPKLLQHNEPLAGVWLPQALEPFRGRIDTAIRSQIGNLNASAFPLIQGAVNEIVTHAEIPLFIVLVPILGFFFLKDAERIRETLIVWIAEDASTRAKVDEILLDVHRLLSCYIRALLLLSLATFVVYAAFLSMDGVSYGALLALVAALLEFIPVIGPLLAIILIVLVSLITSSGHVLWFLIFAAAYRMFQDYVLAPYLMGTGVELHPLLVLFGVLAGQQIAGIPGMLLSVPVIAILRVVYLRAQRGSRQHELAPEEA
jgi:predicted PurR-regulated permease PerM